MCSCKRHNKICHRLPIISKEFNLRRWALLISPAEKWFVSFISDCVSSPCGSDFLLIHKNNQNNSHPSQYEKSNLSFLWLNEFTYPFLGDEVHLPMLSSNGLCVLDHSSPYQKIACLVLPCLLLAFAHWKDVCLKTHLKGCRFP